MFSWGTTTPVSVKKGGEPNKGIEGTIKWTSQVQKPITTSAEGRSVRVLSSGEEKAAETEKPPFRERDERFIIRRKWAIPLRDHEKGGP